MSSRSTALGMIGGRSIMTVYSNFRFNLGPGEDKSYHKITAFGMRNVTAGFGKYNLEEIGQKFRWSISYQKLWVELRFICSRAVKNTLTRVLRVLPSGVGVYLSPFKDVWGSRTIFAGPSKVFTRANKDQQRELNHAVYCMQYFKSQYCLGIPLAL